MKKLIKNKAINTLILASFVFGTSLFGVFLMPKTVSSVTPADPCPDFNNDGKVSLSDLSFFSDTFGLESGDRKYNPQADFDKNGKVDQFDKLIFEAYYNKPFDGCASLPDFSNLCPDYNGDGVVSLSDLVYFSEYYEDGDLSADLNGDDKVDETDMLIFEAYKQTNYVCEGPSVVSEERDYLGESEDEYSGLVPLCPDFNNDGVVSLSDLTFFSKFMADDNMEMADFNGDSVVDEIDFLIFKFHYGKPFNCQEKETTMLNLNNICPDFNGDHYVGLSDLVFFNQYMNENNPLADFNGDGIVDEDDFEIFKAYYNQPYTCNDYSFLDPVDNNDEEGIGGNEDQDNGNDLDEPEPEETLTPDPTPTPTPAPVAPDPVSESEIDPAPAAPTTLATPTGTVLGAATGKEGVVAGAEDELPRAGSHLVFWLLALANSTLGLYSLKRIK